MIQHDENNRDSFLLSLHALLQMITPIWKMENEILLF